MPPALKRQVIVIAAAWQAGCAAPSIDQTWFQCETDHACVLVPDPASCVLIPVNRRYSTSFERRLALEHVGERPKDCAKRTDSYRPICADERCSARPIPPEAPPQR
jgi:hypothetical protein